MTGFRFSQRTLDRCRGVDPRLMAVGVIALSRSPVDWGVTEEQSRTEAEQREKVRRGVSKTMTSKHMIPAGKSFSSAVDFVPFIDGRFQWGDNNWRIHLANGGHIDAFFEMASVMRDAAIMADFKIRWGGCWDRTLNELHAGPAAMKRAVADYRHRHPGPDFVDGPHFELLD